MKYINDYEITKKRLIDFYDNKNKNVIDYLISILGNVEISDDNLKVFINQFSRFGGRYNVLTEPDTIRNMYYISDNYPKLSSNAINSLFPMYIKDLFEKEELIRKLDFFIKNYGYNDEMFEKYLDYVDSRALILQKEYEEEVKIFDELESKYSLSFVNYLKSLCLSKHYDSDMLLSILPSERVISADEQKINNITKKYRIFFGICYPISYKLIEKIYCGEEICEEDLYYIIKFDDKKIKIPAEIQLSDFYDDNSKKYNRIFKMKGE